MIRLIITILSITVLGYGIWHFGNNNKYVRQFTQQHFDTGEFHTLEIRYSAEAIMDTHRRELLKDEQHEFLEPVLRFYPYLLMKVKYSRPDATTGEGSILWGMDDGEMVISTQSWEKTHGFEDCINANADQSDFKIINALSGTGGSMSRKELGNRIHIESELLDAWIDSCKKKKLVVQSGNDYRLHFETPKILVLPATRIDHWLVTQPYKGANRATKRYSKSQIEKIANLAFGQDFSIRSVTEIFLPVFRIEVQNPDGSIYTTHWNALNGKRLRNLSHAI